MEWDGMESEWRWGGEYEKNTKQMLFAHGLIFSLSRAFGWCDSISVENNMQTAGGQRVMSRMSG